VAINGIAHVAFTVKDVKRSIDFYCGVLGFKKLFELKFEDGDSTRDWITYLKITDHQFLELFAGGEEEIKTGQKAIAYSHLSLEVSSVAEITESVRSKGIAIDTEPQVGLDGNWQSWIRDPDGNRIEFMEYGKQAFQLEEYDEPGCYVIRPDMSVKRVK
jgi:lactoylglutathione lyase